MHFEILLGFFGGSCLCGVLCGVTFYFGSLGGLPGVKTCSRSLSRLLSGVCEGPFGGLTGISFFFGEIRHVLGHFLVAFWTLLLGGVPCVGCHSRLAGSV